MSARGKTSPICGRCSKSIRRCCSGRRRLATQSIGAGAALRPIEDRKADERKPGEKFEVPEVSNVQQDGSTSGEMDLHTLNLKSNFLWHSDSTFLPTPALTNILIGRVVTTEGGATELASTRASLGGNAGKR